MANTVIALKKSAIPSAAPGSLANGEIAINYADGIIYYKAANGVIASISSGTPSFGTINAAGTLLIADQINDVLDIRSGDNITITGDAINDKLTIDANLIPANNWANTKLSNGTVTLAGSLTTTGPITANSYLYVTPEAGQEGGEIQLFATGNYTNWSIDSYQNNYRVFARTGTTVSNVTFFHATGGSIRMGVNKTDPGYDIDVSGDVNVTGAFRVNGVPLSTGTVDLTPANNWANTIATAGNNYTNAVGVAGNNYSISVGASSNAWANTLALAGNNYTNSVGVAGNNYTVSVGAAANNWANTKLSNTDNVVFNGSLQIANTLYAKDIVIANTLTANISGNITNLIVTNNVFIGGSITNVTQLMFNTGTNITPTQSGVLTWSQDDSTLHFNTDTPGSAIVHIGQDLVYLVKNQSGSTIYKGNVCMFAGTVGASGRLLVNKAIANNAYPSKYVMGVAATNILNGDDGIVIAQGKVRGIDTSMFSAGDILYLSSTNLGGYSNVMPTAPNNKVTIAAVIYSDINNGSLQIRPTLGSKLNEDEYVEINGISNGDMLMYVSANGRFENKPQSSINAGLLDGYDTSSANVPNTVIVRDQWGNFSAGNITCSLSNTGFIDMRLQSSDPAQVEGRIWYDGSLDHALNYYTDITGVSVAMGRQQVLRVRNTTANTFTVGQAVYATGGSVSKIPDVDLAIANDLTKSQVIGVVFGSSIGTNSFGYVMAMGTYVHGDTTGFGPEGTRLYLSPTSAGALQNTMPPAPYQPVQIGVVTYQNNALGTILISSIQRLTGLNLANGSIGFLVDGTQGRVADDQANLRYDTGNTTLWVNKVNTGILFVDGINVQPSFTAVNNYTISVGSAVNSYAQQVGQAANNHALQTYVKLTSTNQTITGDLSITGNLIIGGNTTSISANNLVVNDSLIYLANNNVSDILDIGFIGSYYNATSSHVHTGLFRDHESKQYYLFNGYDDNPETNNDIVPYSNNMVNAVLIADFNTSNLTLGGANAITWITAAFNAANNGTAGSNAYIQSVGAASNTWANTVGIAGNNYTDSVGTAGNNYTNSVGVAGNNYTNSVGIAGNNYTNSVGIAGNNYTLSIATAANNWANTKVAAVTSNSNARIWANTSIDGNNNENVYLDLSTSGVTATTYGGTTQIPVVTIDAYGRVTSAANASFSSGGVTVTDEVTSASTYYPTLSLSTTGTLSAANTSSTKLYFVPSTGTLSATNFNSLSDISLKTDIEPIDGLSLLNNVDPVSFSWKDNGNKSYGVIAQEIEKVLPELVEIGENGLKSVSYIPMIAMLIDVVKKQQKEIDEIKKLLNR